jgi:hypothetical protein
MPGDRLTFPVWVGSENDLALLLGRRLQLRNGLAAAFHHLVVGLEAVFHIHGDLLFGQVADVAHRGANVKTVSQKPLQSPRLGGRLDDDQSFWHSTSLFPTRDF